MASSSGWPRVPEATTSHSRGPDLGSATQKSLQPAPDENTMRTILSVTPKLEVCDFFWQNTHTLWKHTCYNTYSKFFHIHQNKLDRYSKRIKVILFDKFAILCNKAFMFDPIQNSVRQVHSTLYIYGLHTFTHVLCTNVTWEKKKISIIDACIIFLLPFLRFLFTTNSCNSITRTVC